MAYNNDYGKATEKGGLLYAPYPLTAKDGAQIFTNSEFIHNEHGYYRIVRTAPPADAPDGQHYAQQGWAQNGTEVNPVWALADNPIPVPTVEEQVAALQAEMDALLGEEVEEEREEGGVDVQS